MFPVHMEAPHSFSFSYRDPIYANTTFSSTQNLSVATDDIYENLPIRVGPTSTLTQLRRAFAFRRSKSPREFELSARGCRQVHKSRSTEVVKPPPLPLVKPVQFTASSKAMTKTSRQLTHSYSTEFTRTMECRQSQLQAEIERSRDNCLIFNRNNNNRSTHNHPPSGRKIGILRSASTATTSTQTSIESQLIPKDNARQRQQRPIQRIRSQHYYVNDNQHTRPVKRPAIVAPPRSQPPKSSRVPESAVVQEQLRCRVRRDGESHVKQRFHESQRSSTDRDSSPSPVWQRADSGLGTETSSLPATARVNGSHRTSSPATSRREDKHMVEKVGCNLFNRHPAQGVRYIQTRCLSDKSPKALSKFFRWHELKLSKLRLGEFLGDLRSVFAQQVLQIFTSEIDFRGKEIDAALRDFQSHVLFPGESQKIERFIEVFAAQYCEQNPLVVAEFEKPTDMVLILAFAIIMLNTDLHNPNIRDNRRMTSSDFVRNLKGVDASRDWDDIVLTGIYTRIKADPLKSGKDNTSLVREIESVIIGVKNTLALPHRRAIVSCYGNELTNENETVRDRQHERKLYVFNDSILFTKPKRKRTDKFEDSGPFILRESFALRGMKMVSFKTKGSPFGLRLTASDGSDKIICCLSHNDHVKLHKDITQAILENDMTETLRTKQRWSAEDQAVGGDLSRRASLQNLADPRRCSGGSLDSGVAVSGSSVSIESSGVHSLAASHSAVFTHHEV